MLGVFLQFHKWKDLSNDVPYNLLSYETFVPLRVSSVLNDNVLVDNEPANFPRQIEGPLEGYQLKLVSFAWSVAYPEHGHLKVRTLAKARWFGWREAQACPQLDDHAYSPVHHYSQLANCSCIDGGVVRFCGHKDTRAGGLGTFSQRNTSLIGSSLSCIIHVYIFNSYILL